MKRQTVFVIEVYRAWVNVSEATCVCDHVHQMMAATRQSPGYFHIQYLSFSAALELVRHSVTRPDVNNYYSKK